MKKLLLAAMVIATSASCAEDLPGIVPPPNQLYYPTGLAFLPGNKDTIAVCNSNFDQRYNAGSILTLTVDDIFRPIQRGTDGKIVTEIVDTLPVDTAVTNPFVRVQNFCGDLVAAPFGGTGKYRLFATIRGRNRLTMIDADNGALNCKTAIAAPVLGTDCTPAYSVRTNFGDPFAVAYATTASVVAVGHLLTEQTNRGGDLTTGVAHADMSLFDSRIVEEGKGNNPDEVGGAVLDRFRNISGTNAMVYVPPLSPGSLGMFLAGGRRVGIDTRTAPALVAFPVRKDENNVTVIDVDIGIDLEDTAGIQEVRGIVLSSTVARAYVSVRYDGVGGTINSGLAVVSISEQALRVLSVAEAGDELGAPALIERMIGDRMVRVVYVPDLRSDSIWVFDVSSDRPQLLSKIDGRMNYTRPDGKAIIAHTLDAPAKIVFVERGDRTLGFVSNFANSTLSVIDASNPIAPQTEVIARFGQALTSDGKNEGDE